MSFLDRIRVLRSKNAGPFILTLDVVFREPRDFAAARSKVTLDDVARAYAVDRADVVSIGYFDDLLAVKISINRRRPAGHPGDGDCYGMNQEEPLARLLERLVG